MTQIYFLQRMIDDLRHLRDECEPKTNGNPRYHKYSNAISSLKWIIQEMEEEQASVASTATQPGAAPSRATNRSRHPVASIGERNL